MNDLVCDSKDSLTISWASKGLGSSIPAAAFGGHPTILAPKMHSTVTQFSSSSVSFSGLPAEDLILPHGPKSELRTLNLLIPGVSFETEAASSQWPAPDSHGAKTQFLSMTPSICSIHATEISTTQATHAYYQVQLPA